MTDKMKELDAICLKEYVKLNVLDDMYLSDAGKAAKEAYQSAMWYFCFHDSLKELEECEKFMELELVPGKHPEYYRIIRKIKNFVQRGDN